MKPTQTNLAGYLGMRKQSISKMKKNRPKVFALLWAGWIAKCDQKNKMTEGAKHDNT